MFPGQGSQHLDMCREIYEQEAVFRQHFDTCAEILRPSLEMDLREVVFPPSDESVRDEATRVLTQNGGCAARPVRSRIRTGETVARLGNPARIDGRPQPLANTLRPCWPESFNLKKAYRSCPPGRG